MNIIQENSVSIIILNYNGFEMLQDCLASAIMTDYPNYEVIVVDNGSKDKSCDMVREKFPTVKLVNLPENVGYSRGNNIGILQAKGNFIVLLNNDTTVRSTWLSELMKEAKNQPDCFYQPKILFMNTSNINSLGNRIQIFGFAFPSGIGQVDGQFNGNYPASYASGACVLASRHLVKKVGLLDEHSLFTFFEDVNWGWRALMQGYKSICVSSAVVYHKWGGSWGNGLSSKKFFLIERARLATLLRNYELSTLVCLLPTIMTIEVSLLLYSLKSGFFAQKMSAYSDIIKCRKVIAQQRKILIEKRKHADSFIIQQFSDDIVHPFFNSTAIPVTKILSFLSKTVRFFIR